MTPPMPCCSARSRSQAVARPNLWGPPTGTIAGSLVEGDRAVERAVIRQGKRIEPEPLRLVHEVADPAEPVEERELRVDVEVREIVRREGRHGRSMVARRPGPGWQPWRSASACRGEIASDRPCVDPHPGRHRGWTGHDSSFPRSIARYRNQTCAAVIFRFFSWSGCATADGRPYGQPDKRGRH